MTRDGRRMCCVEGGDGDDAWLDEVEFGRRARRCCGQAWEGCLSYRGKGGALVVSAHGGMEIEVLFLDRIDSFFVGHFGILT